MEAPTCDVSFRISPSEFAFACRMNCDMSQFLFSHIIPHEVANRKSAVRNHPHMITISSIFCRITHTTYCMPHAAYKIGCKHSKAMSPFVRIRIRIRIRIHIAIRNVCLHLSVNASVKASGKPPTAPGLTCTQLARQCVYTHHSYPCKLCCVALRRGSSFLGEGGVVAAKRSHCAP